MVIDNELIAKFMDLQRSNSIWSDDEHAYTMKFSDCFKKIVPSEMKFHSSWDWLMPVIEKIAQHTYESYNESNGYKDIIVHDRAYPRTFGMIDNEGKWMVRINRQHLEQENTLIEAAYKSVIEFIKWFNDQPK